MPIVPEIEALKAEMTAWRRRIHAQPETAFEEVETARFVAQKLEEFGLDEVHTAIAKTGVVGVLRSGKAARAGNEPRAIGLRADLDALHIRELNETPHRSRHDGRMHACGHDGHTAMLLGAAKHLAATRNVAGTVYFIFQPAEENEGGGRAMVEAGLFERFPMKAVFGLHNWPGLPIGQMAVRAGPMLASCDVFEIALEGRGTHAAMPHLGRDPVVAGAALVQALQTIASREIDPLDSAVVSVTQFHAGDTWNVIPEGAVLRGTTRAFRPEVQDALERRLRELAEGIASSLGVSAKVRYERRYPPTVNNPEATEWAAAAAAEVVGEAALDRSVRPTMGAEDFAFMLEEKAGCYIFLGNGPRDGGRTLHSPHYDFNDDALPVGASYWVTLARRLLPQDA